MVFNSRVLFKLKTIGFLQGSYRAEGLVEVLVKDSVEGLVEGLVKGLVKDPWRDFAFLPIR